MNTNPSYYQWPVNVWPAPLCPGASLRLTGSLSLPLTGGLEPDSPALASVVTCHRGRLRHGPVTGAILPSSRASCEEVTYLSNAGHCTMYTQVATHASNPTVHWGNITIIPSLVWRGYRGYLPVQCWPLHYVYPGGHNRISSYSALAILPSRVRLQRLVRPSPGHCTMGT